MLIFPAIDLIDGKAVRLLKGDYDKVTVYNDDPVTQAKEFERKGAKNLHLVDLDGAKTGETPNIETIRRIVNSTSLFVELGGGIRSMDIIKKYLDIGVDRVILGTAAVTNEKLLEEAASFCGDALAVGVDIKNGKVAIKGWLEESQYTLDEFCSKLQNLGIKTVICTDIDRDGAMRGANLQLYRDLSKKYRMNFTASGGVSSIEDIKALREMNLYAAIIGKAYYTGAIDLTKAIAISN